MSKETNINVFTDTESLCKKNQRLADSISESVSKQKIILEKDGFESPDLNLFESKAKVVISKKRTFSAASQYKNNHVAVLNFASATNPGGGVKSGSSAQEECLCRCSGLYFALNTDEPWKKFYKPHRMVQDPIHNDDIIYTPGITVFKTDTSDPILMKEDDWYNVDVITCAAPNLRLNPNNQYNRGEGKKTVKVKDTKLLAIHEKRLRRILDVAIAEGCDTVILGAFGCGAFQNSPEVVARANKNVLKDYLHAFTNIEYAIYGRDDKNYTVFYRILKEFV